MLCDEKVTSVDEAWTLIGAVRQDIRTVNDVNEEFECRTGCLASAKQTVAELQRFVTELLGGEHGRAEHASRQELLLPEAVQKLAAKVASLEPQRSYGPGHDIWWDANYQE